MPTLVIIGGQWGDEAKGKLVDVLANEAELVVRYSGGNNAGHTVIFGDQTFKFHLLPVGITHPSTTAVLGSGMVVCPKALLEELALTRSKCPQLGSLKISSAAHVVFPYHRMLDALEEEARGDAKIGTTLRGIGPAYQDKVARFGIRMGELVTPEIFRERLRHVLEYKNRLLTMFGSPTLEFEEVFAEFSAYADQLREYVTDTEPIVQEAVLAGRRVLFEGAQSSFLDLDSGTYPYVTSSHPVAGGACLGTGIGPMRIDGVIGVAKAYTTRVGEGPFPTELLDETGQRIRDEGQEYGTSTGRPRRCGWLDLVMLRHSARLNAMSGLALTRLDVLSGIPKLKVATGYTIEGVDVGHVPANTWEFAKAIPQYEEMEGWEGNLRTARRLEDLPAATRRYLEFVSDFTQTPIAMVSIGPDRAETILPRPDLIWG